MNGEETYLEGQERHVYCDARAAAFSLLSRGMFESANGFLCSIHESESGGL